MRISARVSEYELVAVENAYRSGGVHEHGAVATRVDASARSHHLLWRWMTRSLLGLWLLRLWRFRAHRASTTLQNSGTCYLQDSVKSTS